MLLSPSLAGKRAARALGVTTLLGASLAWRSGAVSGVVAVLAALTLIAHDFKLLAVDRPRQVSLPERLFWLLIGMALLFAGIGQCFEGSASALVAAQGVCRVWSLWFAFWAVASAPSLDAPKRDSAQQSARFLSICGMATIVPAAVCFFAPTPWGRDAAANAVIWPAAYLTLALAALWRMRRAEARRWRWVCGCVAGAAILMGLAAFGPLSAKGFLAAWLFLAAVAAIVGAALISPSTLEVDRARKLAALDDGGQDVKPWFLVGLTLLPILDLAALWSGWMWGGVDRLASALTAMLGLSCLGLVHAYFHADRRQLGREREREYRKLKKARRELESEVADTTIRLSQTQIILDRQIAKSRELEKALRENTARYRVLVETMNDGLHVMDARRRITYANAALCRMLGISLAEIENRCLDGFFDSDQRMVYEAQWRAMMRGLEDPFEISWRAKDGRLTQTIVSPRIILDENGRFRGGFWVVTDLTRLKQAEEEIRAKAYYDSLTQLANRAMFIERLKMTVAQARASGRRVAILIVDIDRFKRFNESLGHAKGDRLLQAVAERLGSFSDWAEIAARLSGDEFALALLERDGGVTPAVAVERVQRMFDEDFQLDGLALQVTVSIGVSQFPGDGEAAEELLKNAGAALNHAKKRGRGYARFYRPEMNAAALARLKLEGELRTALEREEFLLWHQPKLDLRQGRIVGAEALVRWRHPQRGLVGPGEFIGLAEECGLIHSLGEWILETACRQARVWQEQGLAGVKVAVNVSPSQFRSEQLADRIRGSLTRAGLNPSLLELEIPETLAMEDAERSLKTMRQLSALGVRLAIDDFGAGYTSLGYLRRFPVETLKIDRCFVENAVVNRADEAIVRSVAAMGRSLGLEVIAEGIETEAQLDLAVRLGCDQVQGFLIGRPGPVEDLSEAVATTERWIMERDIRAIDWEREELM